MVICRGGPVNVNLKAATSRGVKIAYTPARNAAATAEHTIAMMLSALRGIPAADAGIRRGKWNGDYTYQSAGFELESATVGLIGYGAIGRKTAAILRGFGTRCWSMIRMSESTLLRALCLFRYRSCWNDLRWSRFMREKHLKRSASSAESRLHFCQKGRFWSTVPADR